MDADVESARMLYPLQAHRAQYGAAGVVELGEPGAVNLANGSPARGGYLGIDLRGLQGGRSYGHGKDGGEVSGWARRTRRISSFGHSEGYYTGAHRLIGATAKTRSI
jgi:hypothetical protein